MGRGSVLALMAARGPLGGPWSMSSNTGVTATGGTEHKKQGWSKCRCRDPEHATFPKLSKQKYVCISILVWIMYGNDKVLDLSS